MCKILTTNKISFSFLYLRFPVSKIRQLGLISIGFCFIIYIISDLIWLVWVGLWLGCTVIQNSLDKYHYTLKGPMARVGSELILFFENYFLTDI